MNVHNFGDLLQFDPVGDKAVWDDPPRNVYNRWLDITDVSILNEPMRQVPTNERSYQL